MITLKQPSAPFELTLPFGVTVTVTPLTTAAMAMAQAAARRRLEREHPDLEDETERDGLFHACLIRELAARHITAWQGVAGEDGHSDALVTKENVAALIDLYPIGERFYQAFTLRQVLMHAAKNVSGPSADGISNAAAGRDTAGDAMKTVPPAPEASQV